MRCLIQYLSGRSEDFILRVYISPNGGTPIQFRRQTYRSMIPAAQQAYTLS